MFSKMGLWVIKFPNGRFGFVGSIPSELGTERAATAEDIMAGRYRVKENGEAVYFDFPPFATPEDALRHATNHGHSARMLSAYIVP